MKTTMMMVTVTTVAALLGGCAIAPADTMDVPGLEAQSAASAKASAVQPPGTSDDAEETECTAPFSCYVFIPLGQDWGGVMQPAHPASCEAYSYLFAPSSKPQCYTWVPGTMTVAMHPECMTPEMVQAEGGNPESCAPCAE